MKKRLLSILLALVMALSVLPGSAWASKYDSSVRIPEAAVEFEGHMYMRYDHAQTWHEAKKICENQGGHLVTITSEEEQRFVRLLLEGSSKHQYWIGLSSESGSMTWVTGEPLSYENWDRGEPNHMTERDGIPENYVQIYNVPNPYVNLSQRFCWNDMYEDNTFPGQEDNFSLEYVGYICEWDYARGFWPEQDGWCIPNTWAGFGYGDGYTIPAARYQDTFGYNPGALLERNQSKMAWTGSCFGMSLLAIANYNGQIDLKQYFDKPGDDLAQYGYQQVAKTETENGRKSLFSVAGNQTVIELIERAQISQISAEMKEVEKFRGDSDYSELLAYLNGPHPHPLLVNLGTSHTTVISTAEKPKEIDGQPGWYRIRLYDPNAPRSGAERLNIPISCYYFSDSYLDLNTNNGDWKYWVNGKLGKEGERDMYFKYMDLHSPNIHFFDISELRDSFFTDRLTVRILGDLIYLDFCSADFTLKDYAGNVLFAVEDSIVTAQKEGCEFTPIYGSDGELLQGIVSIPNEPFQYSGSGGDFVVFNQKDVVSFRHEQPLEATVDMTDPRIRFASGENASVDLVVQRGAAENDYEAFRAELDLNGSDVEVRAEDMSSVQMESSGPDATVRLSTESSRQDDVTTFPDMPVEKLESLDVSQGTIEAPETPETPATPESPDSPWISPFVDVTRNDWFFEEVAYAVQHGLMQGVGGGRFAPSGSTTRAMIVTILYRLEGEPSVSPYTHVEEEDKYVRNPSPFRDVAEGQWYADAVAWAAANKIVEGFGNNTFGPDNNITREQLATILFRYAEYKDYRTDMRYGLTNYNDFSSISSWAQTAMGWANYEGLIKGRTSIILAPKDLASRAETATILMRFCRDLAGME